MAREHVGDAIELVGEGFVSVLEAAKFLRVSRAMVYVLLRGGLPHAKLGARTVIPMRALKEFAAGRLQGARRG